MEQELYFDKDDKLGRKRYAEFLKNLILNSSDFKREDERRAFSIAIDSPWGTGKSYFLNMLKNHLRGLSSDKSTFDPNGPFRVVLYNAWENDCWNNAFEPLAQKFCESSDIGDLLKENKAALKAAAKSIGIILQGIGEKAVQRVISDHAIKKLGECMENVYAPYLTVSEEYVKFRQSVDTLKHVLSEAAKELQQRSGNPCAKVVIIIDELDRCRPDFAVQTMEFVKHLFDAENVVFLFALDMSQLRHSVKSIYGEGMDAEGYLIRFFDYYGKLLEPDIRGFIADELKGKVELADETIDQLASVAQDFGLSLRDIKTVIKVFLQMEMCILDEYENAYAHILYFGFLTIKYKFPNQFKEAVHGHFESIPKCEMITNRLSGIVSEKQTLNKMKKYVTNSKEEKIGIDSINVIDADKDWISAKLDQKTKIEISLGECRYRTLRFDGDGDDILLNGDERVNEILFFNDLKKWDQIKDLTPAQYLMQQLEMFDFFQPNNQ